MLHIALPLYVAFFFVKIFDIRQRSVGTTNVYAVITAILNSAATVFMLIVFSLTAIFEGWGTQDCTFSELSPDCTLRLFATYLY